MLNTKIGVAVITVFLITGFFTGIGAHPLDLAIDEHLNKAPALIEKQRQNYGMSREDYRSLVEGVPNTDLKVVQLTDSIDKEEPSAFLKAMKEEDIQLIVDNVVTAMIETTQEGTDALRPHLAPIILLWDAFERDEFMEAMKEPAGDPNLRVELKDPDYYIVGDTIIITLLIIEEHGDEVYKERAEMFLDRIGETWILYKIEVREES